MQSLKVKLFVTWKYAFDVDAFPVSVSRRFQRQLAIFYAAHYSLDAFMENGIFIIVAMESQSFCRFYWE